MAGVWRYRFSSWPNVSALWQVSGIAGSVPGLTSVNCDWCLVLYIQCLAYCLCTVVGWFLVLQIQCLAWRQCTVAGVRCYKFSAWTDVSVLWQVSGVTSSVPGLSSVYCGRWQLLQVQCLVWCHCTVTGVWCYRSSAWTGVSVLCQGDVWCYRSSAWTGVSVLCLVSGVIDPVPGPESVYCG